MKRRWIHSDAAGFFAAVNVFLITVSSSFGQAGALDPTFNPGAGANGPVYGMAVQPDGKVVIVGDFATVGDVPRNRIARLNVDGSLDATFDPGTGANDVIISVAVRNGKIVVGGRFGSFNGQPSGGVMRLHLDGSVDATFSGGAGCESVAILSDNRIVLGGTGGPQILRLLPSGAIDESFAIAVDRRGDMVFTVAVQPDDQILFGGDFFHVNDVFRFRIARARADGTLDTEFDPTAGSSYEVDAIGLREDGKIYQCGYIVSRLNANGTIDPSFEWLQFNGRGRNAVAVAVQPDGKPVVGGNFTSVENWQTGQGTNRNYIARINNDGSFDASFGAGESLADNTVRAVAVQPDGRILLAGLFTTVNGAPRNGVARLLGDRPVLNTQSSSGGELILKWPAAYTNYVLQTVSSLPSSNWLQVAASPTAVNQMNVVTNPITSSNQFFRLARP